MSLDAELVSFALLQCSLEILCWSATVHLLHCDCDCDWDCYLDSGSN